MHLLAIVCYIWWHDDGYHDGVAVPQVWFMFICLYFYVSMHYLTKICYDDMMMTVQWLSSCLPQDSLCLYLYALFDISIIWWHDADGYHDGLAVPPQGILEKHCQGRVSVRNPHLRFSHQDFVLALKNVSKDINLRKKIITIAYISSPFDPLIVWLAQISHFPGWN